MITPEISVHKPCAAALYFVSTFDPSRNFYWEAVGENCVQEELNKLAEKCIEEMRQNERMVMTQEDNRAFNGAQCCHICKGEFGKFGNKKVRGHDHRRDSSGERLATSATSTASPTDICT